MSHVYSQAMILAAGFGKRMLPLTKVTPKPLANINGNPIIYYLIEKFLKKKIKNIVVNSHYLAKKINNYIDENYNGLVNVVHEKKILDTGGGIKNALNKNFLNINNEPIIVVNGDVFWIDNKNDIIDKLNRYWNPNLMDVLIVLKEKTSLIGYKGEGDFDFLNRALDGVLQNHLKEKKYVFCGLQLIKPILFKNENKESFSVKELFFKAMKEKKLFGIVDDGLWFHIGTISDLKFVDELVKSEKICII